MEFDPPEGYKRRKIQCPGCGSMCELPQRPAQPQKTVVPEPSEQPTPWPPPTVPQVKSKRPKPPEKVGESEPYSLVGGDLKFCPKCNRQLDPHAVVCLGCGYDERSRTKSRREISPIFQDWNSGWSLPVRVRVYLLFQVVVLASMITGLLTERDPVMTVIAAAFGSSILLFVLGTFDSFIIRRQTKGRPQLWKIWRICFLTRPEQEIPLEHYDRVRIGSTYGGEFLDWVFLASLFCLGIIPALIVAYFVLFRPRYSASLSGTGGYVEELLYRGGNRERAEDIGRVVCDAVGVSLERF